MNSIESKSGYSKDSYAFNFKTSTGDTINFSSYSEESISTSNKSANGVNTKITELSLSAGYEFHYKGDGIDANDLKEIKQAMQNLTPQMKEFMKSSGSDKMLNSTLDSIADGIKLALPSFASKDSTDYMKDSLVKKMDEIFKIFDKNAESLDNSRKLLDKIFARINTKDSAIYA